MDELITLLEDKLGPGLIDYIVALISGISLIVFFLTYNLARKINKKIDKPIIEKQFKVFSEFLSELNSIEFLYNKIQRNGNHFTKHADFSESNLNFFELEDKFNGLTDNTVLLFNQNSEIIKLMEKYRVNPLIPKSIIDPIVNLFADTKEIEFNSQSFYLWFGFPDNDYYSDKENKIDLKIKVKISTFRKNYRLFCNSMDNWIDNPVVDMNLKNK